MSLFGFVLVLAAAVCHAVWNFLVKRLAAGPELVWLFSLLACLIYLPLAITLIVIERPAFSALAWVFIVGSAVLHLAYFLLLQRGYRVGDLSLVYPTARATGPLLSVSLAVLLLGEAVSAQMALGGAIIIGGVFGLSGGAKRQGSSSSLPSLLFGLAAGSLIGSYTVWDAYAVASLTIPPLLLDYASSVGRTVILSPLALKRRAQVARLWTQHKGAVLAVAITNPLAYILALYALTFTPVAYVAPLRELSVVLTVLLGSLLLGEGNVKARLGWALVILGGVFVLTTG